MKTRKFEFFWAISAMFVAIIGFAVLPANAAPAVRLALVAASGSGMEQEVIDKVTDQLQSDNDLKISTVNPDWTGVVSIVEQTDNLALTVRVNGTMTIKTRDGHVLNTFSVQTNKQDFNTSPGTPAPMNKALVESARREAIQQLTERAVGPIQDAVQVEMQTRQKIIQAMELGDKDNYKEGLEILQTIGQETPHFDQVRSLIAEFRMEQLALESMQAAQTDSKAGRLSKAIADLRQVDAHSKRYPAAKNLIASLHRQLAKKPSKPSVAGQPAKANTVTVTVTVSEPEQTAIKATGKTTK